MILAKLRHETKALHAQVEQTMDLPTRLRSQQSYVSLLARFYGYYAPLENRLEAVAGTRVSGLDLSSRRKVHLLREDLTTLGTTSQDVLALPRCSHLPPIEDLEDVFGCLYVLEGSTLGGQIVCRMAGKALGVTADRGCSFFASYGDKVGLMWKDFGRLLEEFGATDPARGDRIVTAAVATFASMDRWLAEGVA